MSLERVTDGVSMTEHHRSVELLKLHLIIMAQLRTDVERFFSEQRFVGVVNPPY